MSSSSSSTALWVAAGLLALGLIGYVNWPWGGGTVAVTKLEIEMEGGFAYIPTKGNDRHFDVAWLGLAQVREDSNNDGKIDESATSADAIACQVPSIGTELMVLRGTIASATPASTALPETYTFTMPNRVEISFPDLEKANIPLTIERTAGKPNPPKPVDPWPATGWTNARYVPSHVERHPASGTDPGARLDPNWDKKVNGRMTLRGGWVGGMMPSDPTAQETDFTFKQGTAADEKFAITDRVLYKVSVPSATVEVKFNNGPLGLTNLVLTPPPGGKPIRLRLRGLHEMNGPISFMDGHELHDSCAFYALVKDRPLKAANWVKMFFNAPTFTPGTQQPSPGYFCGGDWF